MTQPGVPLLLHSLAEFREIIMACLDAAGATSVVEVGGEDGTFTRELLDWADTRNASVVCIDPFPRHALQRLAAEVPGLTLVPEMSVPALGELDAADAYLLDGDHNYFTVQNELQLIWKSAERDGRRPLVFLHDVAWPCGRRDQYYAPETIPAQHRHEYTWEHGVTLGDPGVVVGGFRGEGEFAAATTEGGPRNGVLTAVEDFLADRPELSFSLVPVVFGLGVIHHSDAEYAPEINAILSPYADSILMRRLEENRLALYLAVIELQDRLVSLEKQQEQEGTEPLSVPAGVDLLLRDAVVENRALWRRLEQLDSATEDDSAPEPSPSLEPVPWKRVQSLSRRVLRGGTSLLARAR